ncbi:hypothetical protein Cadr_000030708 [Camelus dromedarius]|uniref:Uncharacterized protein n=1 Tax=Camelus dromedarius TaxID=9838 RepID=A0A5N4BZD5_CAMDR|nr:hypothetical protein Cadr_000030708 [Camelus dromedarius]
MDKRHRLGDAALELGKTTPQTDETTDAKRTEEQPETVKENAEGSVSSIRCPKEVKWRRSPKSSGKMLPWRGQSGGSSSRREWRDEEVKMASSRGFRAQSLTPHTRKQQDEGGGHSSVVERVLSVHKVLGKGGLAAEKRMREVRRFHCALPSEWGSLPPTPCARAGSSDLFPRSRMWRKVLPALIPQMSHTEGAPAAVWGGHSAPRTRPKAPKQDHPATPLPPSQPTETGFRASGQPADVREQLCTLAGLQSCYFFEWRSAAQVLQAGGDTQLSTEITKAPFLPHSLLCLHETSVILRPEVREPVPLNLPGVEAEEPLGTSTQDVNSQTQRTHLEEERYSLVVERILSTRGKEGGTPPAAVHGAETEFEIAQSPGIWPTLLS